MKKLLTLTSLLFLVACQPVEREVSTCDIRYQDGSSHTTNNILKIQNLGDRLYVKVAKQETLNYFEIVEYVIFDVTSYECYR